MTIIIAYVTLHVTFAPCILFLCMRYKEITPMAILFWPLVIKRNGSTNETEYENQPIL